MKNDLDSKRNQGKSEAERVAKLDDYDLPVQVPLEPSKMKPNRFGGKVKFTHGGPRSGAGRKPSPEPLVAKRVYLYPRHLKTLEKIDKNLSAAIRKLVDAQQR